MGRKLKLSTARNILVFMTDSADHISGKTGLGSALTITESKAAGAFASTTPTVTERSNGWYQIALTGTNTNTLGDYALHVTGTGADPTDVLMDVVAIDEGDSVRMGLTALPNANATTVGGLPTVRSGSSSSDINIGSFGIVATNAIQWAGGDIPVPNTTGVPKVEVDRWRGTSQPNTLQSGRVDSYLGAAATDAITAASIAADAVTEIQSGLATSSAVAAVQADTDDIQTRLPAALVFGRIDASVGSMASSVITSSAIATDAITAAKVAADAVAEIQSGLATASAVAAVQADTDDIQTRLPAALVSGRMDASVGAVASNAITAAGIATDAITAAKIAADAVAEIQSGLATSSAVATAQADIDDIQTRLPASLVLGRMDSSMGAVAAAAIAASSFATDAIDANALAASAVAEIQSGLAGSSDLTAVKTKTDLLPAVAAGSGAGGLIVAAPSSGGDMYVDPATDCVSANLVRVGGGAIPAPTTTGVPKVDVSVIQASVVTSIQTGLATEATALDIKSDTSLLPAAMPKIDDLYQMGFGRWKIQGTQLLIYDDDNTTVLATFNLKDDTGAPSSVRVFERVPV